MSFFISEETRKIHLDDENYVEVKADLPFDTVANLTKKITGKESDNIDIALPMLKEAVVGWNFKDENGQDIPFSVEKVTKLKFAVVTDLVSKITAMYFTDPKKAEASEE